MALPDQLRPLLDDALSGSGLLVDDVTVTPAGRRRVVRVTIDRLVDTDADMVIATAPLSLDEVAAATRAVGDALDGADLLGRQPYTLEVTSPGVGRPLTAPRHYQRNVGRLLTITPVDGPQVTGRLRRAGAADLTVEVPATGKAPARRVDLPYAAIGHAVVEVEFARGGADEGDPGADDSEKET